jgi:hypothetical protein
LHQCSVPFAAMLLPLLLLLLQTILLFYPGL